ncbi:mucin-binding protein [Lactobacillus johnsonii]
MLSKNNFKERLRKMEDRQDRFSIRKFSIGAVSVLIGSFIFCVQSTQVAHADTLAEKDSTVVSTKDSSKVVARGNSGTSNPSSNNQLHSANQTIDTNTAKLEHKATTGELKPVSSNTISAVKQPTTDIESSSKNQTLLTKNNAINQSQSNTQEISNNQGNRASTINNTSVNDQANTKKTDTLNTDTTISDAPNYPDTHGVVPTTQYIFDQFTLTNGQLTNNAYTPLNMLITLTTDRNNPGNKLNYYITNNNYSEVYANDAINVDQYVNYTGVGPYPSSNLVIYNFGPNGISVNENNNNFGLAFTFGYGKYDSIINSSDPNPFSSSNVSNAWGDTTPTNVTQTITYVDAQTGQPMPNTPTIESNGLTGQIYQVDPAAEKIIKGYYLVNKERDHGVISQYKNGGTYTNEWVSQSGQLIKEVWHQINSNGVMQVDVYINNVQKYDPNNLKGIVYPSTMSKDGPTQLNIDNGSYVFPNPYVEQTSNIELKYDPLGHIIPVTPDGNPIPNAPTPQYTNSPTNPSAVEPNEPVPNIPGYTPKVSTVTPTDPGTDTKVIYVPIEQGSITVTVHDVTDNVNLPQYGKSSGEQDVGTRFTYDKNTVITDLENKGYKVLNPDVVIPTTISKGAQNIVINVEHELVPVTPENPGTPGQPINPNNPDGPKWPDGTAKNNLEATGTQTIHYEGAGNKTPADNIQHFTFTKSATVDKVTGKVVSETGWNVSSHTFGNVDTPVVAGYHADKSVAGGATITPDDLNKTIVVTYAPNGHVIPVGPNGQPIPDAPQPQFPTNPDNPTGTTPSEVPVVPGYHPENGKPGDPVDPVPGKPGEDVPVKYVPDTPTPETYNGSQTIKFVDGNGTELHTPDTQTATNLTGEHTFGKINTPVIKGYTTTETTAGGATVTKNNPNAVITVTYTPNGHIIPVGPDGKPIPDAPQPQFPTNPDNPSETTPGQVPDVPGYHPESGKPGEPVNPVPGKPGENVPVKYVPDTPAPETYTGSQTIKFVDGNGTELHTPDTQSATNLTGDHTFGKINTPVIKGYTTTETTAGGATVTKNNPNATITVTYTPNGHIIPVGPDGKPIPDAPQPQFPTNPDNPSETTPGQVPDVPGYHPESGKPGEPVDPVPGKPGENVPVKYVPDTPTPETYTGSQTIKFVDGNGTELHTPDTQTATNLTGDHTFGKINTPVIKGYTTTETTAGGATVTKNNPNAVITVTYTPNGHIIPVGPDGKPIPDAPQPQFPTNPDNPSETTPGQVPDVPGYHPESGKPGEPVNPVPGKPGENVPVKYVPDTPTPETYTGSQTIKFVDGTTGKEIESPNVQKATNLTGEHTFGKINTPVIKGYTTTETTAGGATVTKENPNAVITVTYTPNGHIIPVGPDGKPIPDAPQPQFPTNPDNPSETTPGQVPDVPGYHPESGKPGEPVDPVPGKPGENVPVKYVPDTPAPETYTGSQTIKFVDGNGTELHTPDTQTATNLTGDHTFGKINTPVIKGYTTTETTAGGATVTKDNPNATITVTYTPNGHIIPVGPDGKPIPDAPQPQFPTNPDNPSETTPGQVPDVPGYHPESGKPGEPVNSVPGKPGEDIPVKYVPDTPETYTGSQTIKFVDGKTGKEIESPNVQTATNLTGSHTFGKINTPVIKGYTTTQITAGGATVTRDNPNAVVTVTYIPNGHIIPVGPNSKPIPSADQPQFPTNPENPTETTPGQLPVVPGYHPEVGKPGENVNPVPGKPGEDVPVKYVPDTPVKPSTPFTPTTPETPRNNPTRPSETPIANNVESNKKKEELPQTGRKENQAQLIGLAVAGISFLLGLIGDRKKKE